MEKKGTVTPKNKRQPRGISAAEAVRAYQNDPSINRSLWEGSLTEGQKKCVEALDRSMKPVKDETLNRITILSNMEAYMKEAKVETLEQLQGKCVTNHSYMSTSLNGLNEMLERRYHNGLSSPVCLVIHCDGNVKGIDVNETLGKWNGFAQQNEVILARGLRFMVKRVEFKDGWGEAYPVLHFYAI